MAAHFTISCVSYGDVSLWFLNTEHPSCLYNYMSARNSPKLFLHYFKALASHM